MYTYIDHKYIYKDEPYDDSEFLFIFDLRKLD